MKPPMYNSRLVLITVDALWHICHAIWDASPFPIDSANSQPNAPGIVFWDRVSGFARKNASYARKFIIT